MAETVKRTYRSGSGLPAAAATRAKLREAAARLVEQGYLATTMRQIARSAGAGERTLYDAFPTKAALFEHTLGVVVGDEDPVRVAARPDITALREEADPRAAIARLVAYSTALLERAGDLIMVSVEAAGADPDMRAATATGAPTTTATGWRPRSSTN
jgi:AcrR family transcriptional regulator